MTNSTLQWHSVHTYYYDDNKDALILDCIQPLFDLLVPYVERAFFVRHWLRGPHLRLRVETMPEQFAGQVVPRLEAHVRHYFDACPSTTAIDGERMRPVYEKLAASEQERGPLLPLYPDNSIHYLPYDRREHILQSEVLRTQIEQFYVETNAITFAMHEAIRAGHSRLDLALDLLLMTAHSRHAPISGSFYSYRSHADAFLMFSDDPPKLRAIFENQYAIRADRLRERLRLIIRAIDHQEQSLPFVQEWSQLMDRYRWRLMGLITEQAIDLSLNPQQDRERVARSAPYLQHSAFHHALATNNAYRTQLYNRPWFQVHRLILNLLYLHLNRLGIRPIDRFLVCHLAARSVEEEFQIVAHDRISQFAASPAGDPIGADVPSGRG